MKPTDTIKYHGKEYPVYDINIVLDGEQQTVRIGTMELSDALIPEPDCAEPYQDREAEVIDESIFFFVTDDKAQQLSEAGLVKYIEEQL